MAKKSGIDQRIDTLFDDFQPEESVSPFSLIPPSDRATVRSDRSMSVRQNIEQKVEKPTRNIWLILMPLSVLLLVAIFAIVRFSDVSSSPSIEKFMPALVVPTVSVRDMQPPSVPEGLTAVTMDAKAVNLTWAGSKDDTGVVGYTVYRDGVSLATTLGSTFNFSDTNVEAGATYHYAIDAYDQAGNHSAISAPLQVDIPDRAGSLIFLLPVADTYVNADSPTSIYGVAHALRVDASPDVHAYLRFNVKGLAGKRIDKVSLKVYSNSAAPWGIGVVAVTDDSWSEMHTNFNNAPTLGQQLAFSQTGNPASWITFDVTPYVTGEGDFNFGIVTESATAINLASRESGAEAPQLIIDLH